MTYTPHTVWVHPVVWAAPAPKKSRNEVWRKARPCTKERDAYIVEKRSAGVLYKDIAPYTGLSITQCQNIYKRAQGAAA